MFGCTSGDFTPVAKMPDGEPEKHRFYRDDPSHLPPLETDIYVVERTDPSAIVVFHTGRGPVATLYDNVADAEAEVNARGGLLISGDQIRWNGDE